MARIPRLYRVRAVYRNGEVSTRHYQTPEAADARAERFEAGRPQMLSESAAAAQEAVTLDVPTVTVTPSHPVTYPKPAGDLGTLEIPDTTMPSQRWADLIARLGLGAQAQVLGITAEGNALAVEYTTEGSKHAPKVWRVELN